MTIQTFEKQPNIVPFSHDISVANGATETLVPSGTSRKYLRIEISPSEPCVVEITLGITSITKLFNASLITLPFEEFGNLRSTSALTITVTEATGPVRITGSTWTGA